jgi:hypothetical protein
MSIRHLLLQTACLVSMLTLTTGGGCTITLDPTDLDPNDCGGGTTPAEDLITVRIVNQTSHTLDPQIYASAETVSVDDLFQSGNKYTNYGVGRLGLLAGNTSDDFELDCELVRVIGTLGGSFGGDDDGNDLNDPAGCGTRLVLTQDLVFYCGAQITFTYRESAGQFVTTFSVDP